jgi:hypothetical protein
MSMSPQPFSWSTIIGRCSVGLLKLYSSKVSWFWGRGMLKFLKIYFFKETFAIMASTRGLGVKNSNFEGFFPGKEVQKTIFGLRCPRLPHNLR